MLQHEKSGEEGARQSTEAEHGSPISATVSVPVLDIRIPLLMLLPLEVVSV